VDAAAASVWPVTVDLVRLATLPPSVTINFPDRAAVTLARARTQARGNNAFMWSGRGADCSAVFTVQGGGVTAALSCLNASYSIENGSAGNQQLTRYDQSKLPGESSPPIISTTAPVANAASPSAPGGADQVIDILVLYTAGVLQTLDPAGGNVNTRRFAQSAVDQTQHAFDNSKAAAQVNLVHAKKVARADTGSVSDDLEYLRLFAEPINLRNIWAADLVIQITEVGLNPVTCGVANVPGYNGAPLPGPGFAQYALGVVARSCATADYTFAHELAHTLGANHNREASNNTTPVEPWAFGHWATNIEGGARTIMSYPIAPSQCASPCPRVLNYSNSNVYVDWFRTGVLNQQENYRVITEFAPTTAQYRLNVGRLFADDFEL
jgi:hypothetical protein